MCCCCSLVAAKYLPCVCCCIFGLVLLHLVLIEVVQQQQPLQCSCTPLPTGYQMVCVCALVPSTSSCLDVFACPSSLTCCYCFPVSYILRALKIFLVLFLTVFASVVECTCDFASLSVCVCVFTLVCPFYDFFCMSPCHLHTGTL